MLYFWVRHRRLFISTIRHICLRYVYVKDYNEIKYLFLYIEATNNTFTRQEEYKSFKQYNILLYFKLNTKYLPLDLALLIKIIKVIVFTFFI